MAFEIMHSENLSYYQASIFSQGGLLIHAVSTRKGGVSTGPWQGLNLATHVGDTLEAVLRNRQIFCWALDVDAEKIVAAKQVHGDQVYLVNQADCGRGALDYASALEDTDAMITNVPDIPLTMYFADCVPLLIFDPVHKAIGLAHAGWRGTAAKIGVKTLKAMQQAFGTEPEACLTAIGPSIGACCYEVDEPLVQKFQLSFDYWADFINPKAPGKWTLDLWVANRLQFIKAGVPANQVEVAGICTSCNSEELYSYRADQGNTGRLAVIMMLKGEV